jgi:hypothetical protein
LLRVHSEGREGPRRLLARLGIATRQLHPTGNTRGVSA